MHGGRRFGAVLTTIPASSAANRSPGSGALSPSARCFPGAYALHGTRHATSSVDPPLNGFIYKDTTFAMMREAQSEAIPCRLRAAIILLATR
jgi:hypothetical protein